MPGPLDHSDPIVTAVVRSPAGLGVVINRIRRREPGRGAGPEEQLLEVTEEVVQLEVAPAALVRELQPLARAWAALAAVRGAEPPTDAIAAVLADTVPAWWLKEPPPPLARVTRQPPEPAATAANPRAYRGTHRKPPKPAQVTTDLRPYLCSPSGVAELRRLASLAPSSSELSLSLELQRLLWPVRRAPASLRSAIAVGFQNLKRAGDPPPVPMLARLVACGGEAAPAWFGLLEEIPPPHRRDTAEIVLATGNAARPLPDSWRQALPRIPSVAPDGIYRRWLSVALQTLAQGVEPGYLMDGMELASTFRPDDELEPLGGPAGVGPAIRRLLAQIAPEGPRELLPWMPLMLWRRNASLPGLVDELDNTHWGDLGSEHRRSLAELLSEVVHHDVQGERQLAKWKVLRGRFRKIVSVVRAVAPAYRAKAVALFRDLAWTWDEVQDLSTNLGRLEGLVPWLCAPPYRKSGHLNLPLSALMGVPKTRWPAIAGLPDSSFRALESACRRDADAGLVRWAVWTLAERWPEFLVESLASTPTALARLLHTMGSLPRGEREAMVGEWKRHPLLDPAIARLPLEQLLSALKPFLVGGIEIEIPRRLRDHVEGRRQLGPHQIERDRGRIVDQLGNVRLAVFERDALLRRGRSIGLAPRTQSERHALLLSQSFAEQRRMARRALKAYVAGERDFIHEHPQSRAWWRRHPRIPEAIWRRGFPFRATTSAHGEVTLEVEGDLLERLRLGTYVGSCLGLGGTQAYSAAAVALDVNKQVVYARTTARRVIARQVLAVSDDDQLVCFTVYPEELGDEILGLFRDYDETMARELEIPVYRPTPKSKDPGIDLILAKDWWYDYPWDPRHAATGDSRPRSGRCASSSTVASRGRRGSSSPG